jgi:hypothetical protein
MKVSGHFNASVPLSPEKEPLVPIEYEAGWASEHVWTHCGRDTTLDSKDGSKFNALKQSLCQNNKKLENYSI